MVELIISILILLVVVLGFTTFNILRKYEKLEDVSKLYADLFIQLKSIINESNNRLQEIDEKGSFKSDDEIGWFFEQVKHIQDSLNNFNETI